MPTLVVAIVSLLSCSPIYQTHRFINNPLLFVSKSFVVVCVCCSIAFSFVVFFTILFSKNDMENEVGKDMSNHTWTYIGFLLNYLSSKFPPVTPASNTSSNKRNPSSHVYHNKRFENLSCLPIYQTWRIHKQLLPICLQILCCCVCSLLFWSSSLSSSWKMWQYMEIETQSYMNKQVFTPPKPPPFHFPSTMPASIVIKETPPPY